MPPAQSKITIAKAEAERRALLAEPTPTTTRLAAAANADTIRLTAAAIRAPAAGSGSAQADPMLIQKSSRTPLRQAQIIIGADRRPQLLRFPTFCAPIRGRPAANSTEEAGQDAPAPAPQDGAGSKDQMRLNSPAKTLAAARRNPGQGPPPLRRFF